SKLKTHNFEYGVRLMASSLLGQLFNRESEERVNPVGRDLRRRLEGETSLVKTGVWELEDRTAADQIVGH
ncbi:MAG: hypothetical protein P8127_13630, partial [Acidobacteriota bacterium]